MNLSFKLFPKEEGFHPYMYIANMCIPFYFLLQEPSNKLYPGLLLMLAFMIIYRQIFWSEKLVKYLLTSEIIITLIFAYFYNPMYLYIIFVFVYLFVRLPLKWMYGLCGLFTLFSITLIYQEIFPDQLYLLISFLPPLFGGGILPFIMRASLRYKELNEDLKRLMEEKEQLEESKKRMLADLSHDLKTPMTTIQGYSKALYEELVDDEEQIKRYLKYIHNKSVRVTTLIDELFMFSKLETPDSQMNIEKKDLCEFYREVIVEYYQLFADKEMELLIDIPTSKLMYEFDTKLLYRAISNLLENTAKYNPEHTTVFISLTKNVNSVTLEIGDDGLGIKDDLVNTLFDPFVRGDQSRKNDGGSGLGLAITKKIIEKHEGKVTLDTKPKRGKTNFIIELPVKEV
ncbi:cell wall metabolism sensor histidine kinase WalK [Bacillus sp. AFS040349]|uniref:sensor histidine kinase n=1 Tax=Bacillus sp. AFS040349 TaxID=2033502 RepID=UPI000BFD13D5|nr:HAMP domain-containing sensor histidine kinase [Bacillus sp. AFS040349]PGT77101.1 two-component sensor histidine kinase [Bacillus sp. AFS040349]